MPHRKLPIRRSDAAVLAAGLAAGSLIRLWIFAARPSLWIDEARLALNLGSRSLTGLLLPLDYDQAAPPLFLWASKLSAVLAGMNEYALRALPLLASLALPVLLFALADRMAGRRVAVTAAVLSAVSPGLVRHAAEFKPYQLDAFVATGLLYLYVKGRHPVDGGLDLRTTLAGAIAVWISTPAVLILFVIGIVELAERVGREPPAVARTAVKLGAWAASFVAVYGLVYRPAAANAYLTEFWRPYLLTAADGGWLSTTLHAIRDILAEGFVAPPIELPPGRFASWCLVAGSVVLASMAALGVRWLARCRGRRWAALVAGPWAVAFAASALGVYPIAPRLTLFALPLLIIAVASGLVALEEARQPVRLALATSLSLIFGAGLLWCIDRAAAPGRGDHVGPAVKFFQESFRRGEPVYVLAGMLPAWTFYTTDWRRPDAVRLARVAREASSGGLAFENAPPRPGPVGREGARLAFEYNGWVELLGVSSGTRWLADGTLGQAHPDTNWSWSEAGRIRDAASPSAWVLTGHTPGLDRQLRSAIEALGGRAEESYSDSWVTMSRYYFDGIGARSMR